MENNRIPYLDVLRVIACGMVVLMHTPHPDAGVPGYIQNPLYFLTAGGLVLFFYGKRGLAPTHENVNITVPKTTYWQDCRSLDILDDVLYGC